MPVSLKLGLVFGYYLELPFALEGLHQAGQASGFPARAPGSRSLSVGCSGKLFVDRQYSAIPPLFGCYPSAGYSNFEPPIASIGPTV